MGIFINVFIMIGKQILIQTECRTQVIKNTIVHSEESLG